jgi:hypothetical protein
VLQVQQQHTISEHSTTDAWSMPTVNMQVQHEGFKVDAPPAENGRGVDLRKRGVKQPQVPRMDL